jgi:hypothetical protein
VVSRILIATTAITAVLGAAGAVAKPPPPVANNQDFYFDLNQTHHAKKGSVTGSSPKSLASGAWYVVSVQGTASFSKPSQWIHPKKRHGRPAVVCGTPEAAPLFPSPFAATGQVGFDPETMFARITRAGRCAADPLPRTTRRFEIAPGHIFRHPTPLDGRHTSPTPDHAYNYAFQGLGKPLDLREVDRPTFDNYGRFHLVIRPATAADCAGTQYKAFATSLGSQAFPSAAACTTALGGSAS